MIKGQPVAIKYAVARCKPIKLVAVMSAAIAAMLATLALDIFWRLCIPCIFLNILLECLAAIHI